MKAHLLDSNDPLVSGQDYSALCGQRVVKAEFCAFADTGRFDFSEWLDSLYLCRQCANANPEIEKRYVYAMIPGVESKHEF